MLNSRLANIQADGPQRSRRLSASGISLAAARSPRARVPLKEADAFRRLVSVSSSPSSSRKPTLKEADAFRRLVCGWATRMTVVSVSLKEADAFRRLVSDSPAGGRDFPLPLKEADAFRRLVCAMWNGLPSPLASPQRSRRLSASGISAPARRAQRDSEPSKKQTPFGVWYSLSPSAESPQAFTPQRSRRLSASGMRLRLR